MKDEREKIKVRDTTVLGKILNVVRTGFPSESPRATLITEPSPDEMTTFLIPGNDLSCKQHSSCYFVASRKELRVARDVWKQSLRKKYNWKLRCGVEQENWAYVAHGRSKADTEGVHWFNGEMSLARRLHALNWDVERLRHSAENCDGGAENLSEISEAETVEMPLYDC